MDIRKIKHNYKQNIDEMIMVIMRKNYLKAKVNLKLAEKNYRKIIELFRKS